LLGFVGGAFVRCRRLGYTPGQTISHRLSPLPERRAVDGGVELKQYIAMSSLAEIEKAAESLSPEQKQELMLFLGARLREDRLRHLSPAERAADLQHWAASHEAGPGLPDSATGRETIYD
jgi:hypothetical protein